MGQLVKKLERAWELRMNLRIDECEALLRECRAVRAGTSRETEMDIRLLEASLTRARGDLAGSERLLSEIESIRDLGAVEPFQLPFQQGLNAYMRCDYTTALDRFLVACRVHRSPVEKGYALSNVLLCLECLGLSSDEVFEELKGLATGLDTTAAFPGLATTLRSYELRTWFRAGQFAAVGAGGSAPSGRLMQEQYYQLWVSELPFHPDLGPARLREKLYLASPSFHLKTYRVRTLQMQVHPEDLKDFKVTELCDRIYLWVWKWLSDPARHPVDRIVSLLTAVDLREIAPKLTAEDFQQLRNSLLWLSLFDPGGFASVYKIIQSLQIPHIRDFPLFDFERKAVEYLISVKEKGESLPLLEALRAHPMWKNQEYLLSAVLEALTSGNELDGPAAEDARFGRLAGLRKSLEPFFADFEPVQGAELFVDLSNWVVRATSEKRRTISEPMCLAFHLLKSQGSVGFAEMLRTAFGLQRYDATIHDPKIFNLLARMRQFAPAGLTLKTKGGRIYVSGSWNGVSFVDRPDGVSRRSLARLGWTELMNNQARKIPADAGIAKRWLTPAAALKQLAGKKEISRQDLEKLMGMSRSSASRIISRWIEQGWVIKVGNAKRCRYVFQSGQFGKK
jgi:hypothetical protein